MLRNPTTDLIVVLVIVLLIFGPKRLPRLGRDLGAGLREFKDSITGGSDSGEGDSEPGRPALERAPEPADTAERSAAPAEAAPKRD